MKKVKPAAPKPTKASSSAASVRLRKPNPRVWMCLRTSPPLGFCTSRALIWRIPRWLGTRLCACLLDRNYFASRKRTTMMGTSLAVIAVSILPRRRAKGIPTIARWTWAGWCARADVQRGYCQPQVVQRWGAQGHDGQVGWALSFSLRLRSIVRQRSIVMKVFVLVNVLLVIFSLQNILFKIDYWNWSYPFQFLVHRFADSISLLGLVSFFFPAFLFQLGFNFFCKCRV